MRVFFLCFTLGIGVCFSNNSYSQSTKISLNLKNKTVKQVFSEIEKNSEFIFFYQDDILDVDRKVTVIADNETIEQILNKIFSATGNTYFISDRSIYIIKKELNDIVPEDVIQQQKKQITGNIIDVNGEPIIGANIIEKGTTNGTVTDIDGNFTLQVEEDAVLRISYIGYLSQEINTAGKTTFNVILQEDTQALEELVVIGYGTQRREDVTSSIASVKSEDFVQGGVKDIGQLIQGKVAGLTITSSSGDPLSNTAVSLRGNTTLYGTSSSPLILIDGVPGDFNVVAPEDIESIDVLKDGSAAAIYGTRGSNGVILITTKRASGIIQSSIEYSSYMSTQTVLEKADMLTAADYRQQIAEGTRPATEDLGASTDWFDKITQTPFSQVHNLTFRGGNMESNYLASFNYNDTEGIFKKTGKKTFTARTDINHSMYDGLIKFNLGIISRNIKQDRPYNIGYTYRQAKIYNPTAPVKTEDGSWYENPGAFNYDNPVAHLNESDGDVKSQWSRINATTIINPLEGLNLKALVSYSKYNSRERYYETRNHISTVRAGLNGYAYNASVESIDRLVELTAEYARSIGKHRFTLLGGYSYQDNDWSDMTMSNENFQTDLLGADDIEIGTGIEEGGTSSGIASARNKTNLIGFFGRLNYNYRNRYLFMASLRREEASQLLGTDDPWGTFPAVSMGWRISEESFMKDIRFLDDLKLRVGYGITGTQPNDSFLGVGRLGYGEGTTYYNGRWIRTLESLNNPNPNLRWEEKKETNIGIDFSVLNSRINGSIDMYNRVVDGLLYDYTVPVPPNLVTTTRANVGEMENKGIEVLINVVPVRKKNIEWVSTFSFSTNSNKLKSLANDLYQPTQDYFTQGSTGEPIQTFTHRIDIGDKIGNFYGYKVVDVDDDGKWIYEISDARKAAYDESVLDGNRVHYDDFQHAFEDKQVLGNGLPKWYAGWNNTIRYKNFDLNVTMRGAFNYQILNFERMYLENTQVAAQYNRLQSAYDKVFGKEVLSTQATLEYNSYYIEDGDYWKIDNITLGYTFNLDTKYVKSARLYVSSLNTFTFTDYKGVDPEVSIGGLTPGNDYRDKYPTNRTFTLGVNVNF